MSIEQQALDLVAENEALRQINKGLVNSIDQNDDDRPADLVWLTRDELKGYSDLVQAGGVNAIKADAIEEAAKLHLTLNGTAYDVMMMAVSRLRVE